MILESFGKPDYHLSKTYVYLQHDLVLILSSKGCYTVGRNSHSLLKIFNMCCTVRIDGKYLTVRRFVFLFKIRNNEYIYILLETIAN